MKQYNNENKEILGVTKTTSNVQVTIKTIKCNEKMTILRRWNMDIINSIVDVQKY